MTNHETFEAICKIIEEGIITEYGKYFVENYEVDYTKIDKVRYKGGLKAIVLDK